MKHLQIEKPCTENWGQMNSTQRGAFCQKCATEVIDFTNKSTNEIKSVFREMAGQSICSRFSNKQLDVLNLEFENWSEMKNRSSFQSVWVFSLIVVFGLTLFSCETEKDQKAIKQIQHVASKMINIKSNQESEKKVNTVTIEKIDLLENIDDTGVLIELDQIIISDTIVEYALDDIEIQNNEHISYTLGDMAMSRSYITYLNETVVTDQVLYDKNGEVIPTSFQAKVYPNPAITTTTLELGFPLKDNFAIQLFDISGKFLQMIHQGELDPGMHRFPFEISEYISGTYLIVIHSEKYNETIRLIK